MDKWDKVVDTIVKTIDARIKKPSSAYSTEAQVKRIEGQTAYVDIPGGEPNMPARLTIDAKVGDTVQVSVDDHKATLTGNRTAPPTDDTTANEAKDTAEKNKRKVIKLEEQTGLIRQGVEGAQNMARQAEEDAENALTAANGKNKVYYLATQPTGGTYQIGDTWFDTANDNKIYHWNGTAWTASLLGDDALDTFSANHINAGSIDASDVTISNLDAGNITSGYLNANRIEAGSLSIGKTSGLQTALDNAGAANSYVTTISGKTGISVHMANDTSNYALVNSNGMEVYKSGDSVASFGSDIRLGKTGGRYFKIETDSGSNYRMVITNGTTEYGRISFKDSGLWLSGGGTSNGIVVSSSSIDLQGPLTTVWNGLNVLSGFSADYIEMTGRIYTTGTMSGANVHKVMTAESSASVTLSTQSNYYKLTMAKSESTETTTSQLSISSGGIKCAQAGYVLVSGQAQFTGMTDHHICNVQIKNGTTTVAHSASRSAGSVAEVTIAPRLVRVYANDVIYLHVANTSGTGGTAGGSAASDKLKNYLTVQYV